MNETRYNELLDMVDAAQNLVDARAALAAIDREQPGPMTSSAAEQAVMKIESLRQYAIATGQPAD